MSPQQTSEQPNGQDISPVPVVAGDIQKNALANSSDFTVLRVAIVVLLLQLALSAMILNISLTTTGAGGLVAIGPSWLMSVIYPAYIVLAVIGLSRTRTAGWTLQRIIVALGIALPIILFLIEVAIARLGLSGVL